MARTLTTRWIHLKGWLFLLMAIIASGLIIAETLSWRIALLLGIAIWAACRFYYYAFYVIEKYVDAEYKFAGLGSFVTWWLRKRS